MIVPTLGQRPPKRASAAATDAVQAVAERLTELGLGSSCRIHGSAASGEVAFIHADKTWMVSDIDIVVFEELNDRDIEHLRQDLDSVFFSALGDYSSPATRVGLKCANSALLLKSEGSSLVRSATLGRTPLLMLKRDIGATCRLQFARIYFPFALQYSVFRWLRLVGQDPPSNAVGLHELCKGIWRTLHPSQIGPCHEAQAVEASRAARFIAEHQFVLAREVGRPLARLVREWLSMPNMLSQSPHRLRVHDVRDEVDRLLVRRHPGSLLVDRITDGEVSAHAGS